MQFRHLVVFCHGLPGSPQDATLLPPQPKETAVVSIDVFAPDLGVAFDRAVSPYAGAEIHLAGFSIGAMIATKIAAHRSSAIKQLVLISPAAPLQLGAFLPEMAGKPIFQLAQLSPFILRALTTAQSVLAATYPDKMIRQLFKNCGPAEKSALKDPAVRAALIAGFTHCFRENQHAYVGLLQEYVFDWSATIADVNCPVTIWHGANDGWSPIAMTHALSRALPYPPTVHIVAGHEHYSTLRRAQIHQIKDQK